MQPEPGSEVELEQFAALQQRLGPMFERLLPDSRLPRTVVVVPSLSMDAEMIASVKGVQHYEERLLCMLLLLGLPRTRIVYVTSTLVDPVIVDYYLHLLPGVPHDHARQRLTMISCHDGSPEMLTAKILNRPRLLQRIKEQIADPDLSHMTCFHASDLERTLAVQLGIPIYGCDPALVELGSKSGSRRIFRAADVLMPAGFEYLRDIKDVAEALSELKAADPELQRAVVKLEEGTSGEGNAVFSFEGCPENGSIQRWVSEQLPERLIYEDEKLTWERFVSRFASMGGVVECWIEGERKRSPSVQCRVDPLRQVELISTHDQIMGGRSAQTFKGSTFPADVDYRNAIQDVGLRVGEILETEGALGRYGVDFVSVPDGDDWTHYAIEINLRKGGTTHTYRILQLLTEGKYDGGSGSFVTPQGNTRFYYATDNLTNPNYRRLVARDLIDIGVDRGLHFRASTQTGVFFHLIGALSEFGKLGVVCVAASHDEARQLYDETVSVLDQEALK